MKNFMSNKKGAALIISYVVIAVLATLSLGLFQNNVAEMRMAEQSHDSVSAFWLAEAGLSKAVYNLSANANWAAPTDPESLGGGDYGTGLQEQPASKLITTLGTVGNAKRQLQGEMIYVNKVFENTISSGGDMNLAGLIAALEVYGKTRLGGIFTEAGFGASGWFENKMENQAPVDTTITIPDANGNGTANEFLDFRDHFRDVTSSYNPDEVVYIQTEGTVNIFPSQSLAGKKIVYVEGTTPGAGDVNVYFDTTWQDNQDITIISTGTVDYVEPLQFASNSRLNTISWEEYNEYALFLSMHESVTYSHEDVKYYDLFDISMTTGNIIANNEINLTEIIALKKIYYSDRAKNGDIPPGFEALVGQDPILSPSISNWQEQI